jgi:hypothetical protein
MNCTAMEIGKNAFGSPEPSVLSVQADYFHNAKETTLIILERDGSLVCSTLANDTCPPTRGYAEVSADSIQREHTLIERILSFAFDHIGLRSLELRVREEPKD